MQSVKSNIRSSSQKSRLFAPTKSSKAKQTELPIAPRAASKKHFLPSGAPRDLSAATRNSTEENKEETTTQTEIVSAPVKVVKYIDMLGSPRTEESDEAEEAVVDEFAQRVLAASADADVKAAGAAQKAADASQAMHATAAAVRQTHADLTDF